MDIATEPLVDRHTTAWKWRHGYLAARVLSTIVIGQVIFCAAARADVRDQAVAEVTLRILSFARWPGNPQNIRLCVIGLTEYSEVLLQTGRIGPTNGQQVLVQRRSLDDDYADCNALYVGALSAPQLDNVYRRIAGRAVLTIHERREDCVARGMFCLDTRPPRVRFDVNLDSIARSTVRVHPGVLQMGRQPKAVHE